MVKPIKCQICRICVKIGEKLSPHDMGYAPGIRRMECSPRPLSPVDCLKNLAPDLYAWYKKIGDSDETIAGYINGGDKYLKGVKARLVVLSKGKLPRDQGDLEYQLSSLGGARLCRVTVKGSVASDYSTEALLERTVLGKNITSSGGTGTIRGVPRGCDLYVGLRTPAEELVGEKTKDGRFDRYQLGEIGFEMAKEKGIPAILLDTYDERMILDFVQNQVKLTSRR